MRSSLKMVPHAIHLFADIYKFAYFIKNESENKTFDT